MSITVIYGPLGGGKTTLADALAVQVWHHPDSCLKTEVGDAGALERVVGAARAGPVVAVCNGFVPDFKRLRMLAGHTPVYSVLVERR